MPSAPTIDRQYGTLREPDATLEERIISASASASQSPRYRWVILAVAAVGSITYAQVYQSTPPILPLILRDLGVSHSQAGLLMSAFAIPGIIIAMPAGILAGILGPRVVGSVAMAVLTAGAFAGAFSHSYAVLLVSRILAGAGATALMIMLPQLLGQWFHGREIGLAMGVFQSAFPIGAIAAFTVYSSMSVTHGWPMVFLTSAIVAAAGSVIFATLAKSPPSPSEAGGPASSPRTDWPLVLRRIWPVALAWFWMNLAMLSLLTFTPDALVERGWSASAAGWQTSLILLPSVFLTPFTGIAMDRTGRRLTFVILGMVCVISSMLGLASPSVPVWIATLVLGVGLSLTPPAIYALPLSLVPPRALNLAFALMIGCQSLGVTLGPYLTGLVRDATGSYSWPYVIMAAFACMVPITSLAVIPIRRGLRSAA